jgi:trehalose 6-phosphate phosphatase
MSKIQLQDVLVQRPLGLVFDIDGTLSEIVPTPSEARLYPGAAELLTELASYAEVAIMTGRAVEDGARMVQVPGLTYIGTHGLEWSENLPTSSAQIQLVPEALNYVEPGKRLLALVEREMAHETGIIVQAKSVGGSIHYRQCADPEGAREQILALLEEPARQEGMVIGEGKRVVEVLAPLKINKGEALKRYIERKQLRGVVFAGDDRTDLNAIYAVRELRQEGFTGYTIAIRHTDALPELLASADEVVDEVPGMVERLQQILDMLATLRQSGRHEE